MAFHLEGPWLSTTGKRKGKFKWASAEQKRQAEEQARNWEELKQKHAPKKAVFSKSFTNTKMPKLAIPEGRSTNHIQSRSTGVGVAVKLESPVYTGTKVLGVAVQHKSCLQPVFSSDEAKDSASMRR